MPAGGGTVRNGATGCGQIDGAYEPIAAGGRGGATGIAGGTSMGRAGIVETMVGGAMRGVAPANPEGVLAKRGGGGMEGIGGGRAGGRTYGSPCPVSAPPGIAGDAIGSPAPGRASGGGGDE
jgi:hypothetical protein